MTKFVVAVDGPAGSGKSSVCKEAARRLGFGYLDTGAGYRAMAIQVQRSGSLDAALSKFQYEISLDPNKEKVSLAGLDITTEIRSSEVAEQVRAVAKDQRVRELQRHDARERIDTVTSTAYSSMAALSSSTARMTRGEAMGRSGRTNRTPSSP